MSVTDNLRDLQGHAQDFAERRGFTYTVLSTGTGEVIGCVYIYPPRGGSPGAGREWQAAVSSWVRANRAALDPVLYRAVPAWLERDWPFRSIQISHYAFCADGWRDAGRCDLGGICPYDRVSWAN
jgi:hypothetical protein